MNNHISRKISIERLHESVRNSMRTCWEHTKMPRSGVLRDMRRLQASYKKESISQTRLVVKTFITNISREYAQYRLKPLRLWVCRNFKALIYLRFHGKSTFRQNTMHGNQSAISLLRIINNSLLCTSRRYLKPSIRTNFVAIIVKTATIVILSDETYNREMPNYPTGRPGRCSADKKRKYQKDWEKASYMLWKRTKTVLWTKTGRLLPVITISRSSRPRWRKSRI